MSLLDSIAHGISSFASSAVKLAGDLFNSVCNLVKTFAEIAAEAAVAVGNAVVGAVQAFVEWLIEMLWEAIQLSIQTLITFIITPIQNSIKNYVTELGGSIQNAQYDYYENGEISDYTTNCVFNKLTLGIYDLAQPFMNIMSSVMNLIKPVLDVITSLAEKLVNLIMGLLTSSSGEFELTDQLEFNLLLSFDIALSTIGVTHNTPDWYYQGYLLIGALSTLGIMTGFGLIEDWSAFKISFIFLMVSVITTFFLLLPFELWLKSLKSSPDEYNNQIQKTENNINVFKMLILAFGALSAICTGYAVVKALLSGESQNIGFWILSGLSGELAAIDIYLAAYSLGWVGGIHLE